MSQVIEYLFRTLIKNHDHKAEKNFRTAFLMIILYVIFLSASAQTEMYSVERASFCSPVYNEFSPVYCHGGLLFCSNRENNSMIRYSNIFSLFFIDKKDNGLWGKSRLFAGELTTNFNEGPATFSADGNRIYFTRNINAVSRLKDTRDSSNSLGIFFADLVDGVWGNVQGLSFNSPEYSVQSPSLSRDGARLFFSSDMPGGYGGSDIYYSEFIDSIWQEPVNLGPLVNTSKNESYPFACTSGKLYFASDGHRGFGSLDLYYTMEINGQWFNPVHLDEAINSGADDFGLITDDDLQSGFFSSNRKKSDDIYSFKRSPVQFDTCNEQQENKFCFHFQDQMTLPYDSVSAIYEWDFGSGNSLVGEEVDYCFPGQGWYSVVLRVMDEDTGDTLNVPIPYEFELKEKVQAYIHTDSPCITGKEMQFDALKTNLPGMNISDYLWDFGDGFVHQGPSVNYTFQNAGEYTVKLGIMGETLDGEPVTKTCVYRKFTIIPQKKQKKDGD